MRPTRLLVPMLLAATALLAACSGSAVPSPASAPPATEPAATPTRIEVTLTDALRIDPPAMTVPAGEPVTFVVTNAGTVAHEFVLGDEEEQAAHEQEMGEMGGMGEDEEMAIGLDPGQTKELTVTFSAPGSTLAGCHVTGHYAGGMVAKITIE